MFKIFLLFLIYVETSSRPSRPPPILGESRNIKGIKHFEFSTEGKKQSSPDEPLFKYSIDMVDGFHSLDDEMYIENIDCKKNSLDIFSKTRELDGWNIKDVISGTDMWGCHLNLMRKILSIDYYGIEDNLHHYHLKTEDATFRDYFFNANIKYELPDKVEEELAEEAIEKSPIDLKGESNSISFASNINGLYVESSEGFVFDVKLSGADLTSSQMVVCAKTEEEPAQCFYCTEKCSFKFNFAKSYSENTETTIYLYTKVGSNTYRTDKSTIYINSNKILFLEPTHGFIADSSKLLRISWDVNSRTSSNYPTMKVYLNKRSWVPFYSSTAASFSTFLSNKQYSLDISNIETGTYYLTTKVENVESDSIDFDIVNPNENKVLQILNPTSTTRTSTGSSLEVKWSYNSNMPSTSEITIYLYEELWGFDKKITSVTTTIGQQNKLLSIPNVASGADYYIYITYNCGYYFCDSAMSDLFSINFNYVFNLKSQKYYSSGEYVNFGYSLLRDVGTYYISLHQKYPSILPLDPKVSDSNEIKVTGVQYAGSSYSKFIWLTNGSPFYSYLVFRYNCLFGNYMCTEEKQQLIDVPYNDEFGYNFKNGKVVNPSISILSASCSSCDGGGIINQTLKKLCTKFPQVNVKIDSVCKDCYARAPVKLSRFELVMDLLNIYKASMKIDSELELYFDWINTVHGSYRFYGEQFLARVSPAAGRLSFALGPMKFSFGPYVDFYAAFNFEADVFFKMETIIHKSFMLSFYYDSTANKFLFDSSNGVSTYSNTILGSVSLLIEPQLIAAIGFDMQAFSSTIIKTEVCAKLGAGIKLDFNTAGYQPNAFSNQPHYLEVSAGLFVRYNFTAQAFGKEYKKGDTDLYPNSFPYKEGFFLASGNEGKYGFSVESSYFPQDSDIKKIFYVGLAYDLGLIANQIQNTLFSSTFDPYKISVEYDYLRSKTSMNYIYNVKLMDTTSSLALVEKLKEYVINGYLAGVTVTGNYKFFDYIRSGIKQCSINSCSICSLDNRVCSICVSGFALQSDGTCKRCVAPQYESGGVCKDCESNQVYDYSTSTCKSCADGSIFVAGRSCVQCSEFNKVWDSSLKTCVICSEPKVYDVTQKQCVNCLSPTYYSNGQCVGCSGEQVFMNGKCQDCPDQTVFNSAMKSCNKCQPPTVFSEKQCVSCSTFDKVYDYYTATCVDCAAPLFYSNGNCFQCEPPTVYNYSTHQCSNCEGKSYYDPEKKECLNCVYPQYFDGSKCVSCGSEQLYNETSEKCEYCQFPTIFNQDECDYCVYPKGYLNGKCVECVKPYFYNAFECVQCPEGKYYYYGECIDCENGFNDGFECFFCKYPKAFNGTDCVECEEPFVARDGKCVECVKPFYYENGFCSYCYYGIYENGVCHRCSEEYKILSDDKTKCIPCGNGLGFLYGITCANCSEYSLINIDNVCYVCEEGTFFYNKKCVLCPEDSKYDEISGWCTCNNEQEWFDGESCKSCTEQNASLNDDKCVCNEGLGFSYQSHKCMECEENGFRNIDGGCKCLKSDVYDGKNCYQCEKDSFGYVGSDGECYCYEGNYFEKVGSNFVCVPCSNANAYWNEVNQECMCEKGLGYFDDFARCINCEDFGLTLQTSSDVCECQIGYIWDVRVNYCYDPKNPPSNLFESSSSQQNKPMNSDHPLNSEVPTDFASGMTIVLLMISLILLI